jgi:hypothetical protein
MIRSLKRTKAIATMLLLTSPMLAIGQNQSDTVVFIDQGSPGIPMITYYHAIPGRFFIQRSPDASLDYITSLLNKLTDSPFESSWHSTKEIKNCYCRVVIDDELIDNLIQELLKDDSVLVARRIYVNKGIYDKYVSFLQQSSVDFEDYFIEPNLRNKETVFFNEIRCDPINFNPDIVPQDSICNSIGVTLAPLWSRTFVAQVPKNADVFDVALQLLNTGYFVGISINGAMPFGGKVFDDIYGAKINRSDHFFQYNSNYNDGKLYYHEIQGRFFVEKTDSVSQDYINKLLNNTINGDFEREWLWDDICRVIVNEELIDNIIDELLKDDGIKTARRIYVSKKDYCSYLFYPDLEQGERYLLNRLWCDAKKEDNQALLDSISNSLGLTYNTGSSGNVAFHVPKQADIFEVAQKIFETGSFNFAEIENQIPPIIAHWGETYISQPKDEVTVVKEELYYNLAGQRLESPSGLTIVVTRYGDGSIRREKILFR